MNLLVINSTPNGSNSVTRQLCHTFSTTLSQHISELKIIERDLRQDSLSPLSEQKIAAFYTPGEQQSTEQRALTAQSDTFIAELEAADVIIIGAPMHNFSVNSQLKCYIDHIARVGKTFHYTEKGPIGLLSDKRVFVLSASGGHYTQPPMSTMDHLTPYLKTVLGFIGLEDVTFVCSPGVASNEEAKAQAIASANAEIVQLASALAL